jgi:diguanylate cyclase (GGDEF)-like protein
VGVFCTGYTSETDGLEDSAVGAADFADRLSLILANLRQSERLREQANFDSLTGLQNRHLFSNNVRVALAAAVHDGQRIGSLLYLDLDHFKRVNDTAGHAAGDELLCIVADRLGACVKAGQSVARLGGDEFAVLLPSISELEDARRVADRLIDAVQASIVVDGREHQVSASIGIAVFPTDGTTLEELLKAGDIAMYHAKESGRGCAMFFQAEMQQKLVERLRLESGMQRAFLRQEFTLHYQPIVDEADGGFAAEALIRWPGQEQAPWAAPSAFIPVAEENGLIVTLGEWILRRACRQFALWRDQGVGLEYVSVNVSVRQLEHADFIATLRSALAQNAMQGSDLQVEVTESVLARGKELDDILAEIAALGVRLALDDFGTGYSSLSYLRTYPIHAVKIDRSFVLGLPRDLVACRLTESIIAMCATLGKRVIAEGVESDAQRQFLCRAGCTTIQGYVHARPMDPADIPGFARRLRSRAVAGGDELSASGVRAAKSA